MKTGRYDQLNFPDCSIAKGKAMPASANVIVAFLASLALAGCASSGN
jgi:hypothetical protein